MAIFELRINKDPILRRKAVEVRNFDFSLSSLTENMFETMYESKGIGLAAPQIGISQRLIVIDIEEVDAEFPPLALVNPTITESSGEELGEEGCLSLPDFRAIVRRSTEVSINAQNIDGQAVHFSAQGLMARVLQHEIDHLDGILITDRLRPEDQELLEKAD
ncbi:peptide deformylase [Candidatus Poribacteria bacterium]|nr:peptide deformylase [Candidatus Poribacteria bacterium]MEE2910243.1 peptide deformylase [Candidatus Poribacteria bacterium]